MKRRPRLLAIGPEPPPLNGTSVSFQVFCAEARRHADQIELEVIDSSPPELKEEIQVLTLANLSTAVRVLWRLCRRVLGADRVLVVGSHQFLFTMGTICLAVTKIARRPCYFRSFGYLDGYYESLPSVGRWLFRNIMSRLDGLFVESELVRARLSELTGSEVLSVPGYRNMSVSPNDRPDFGASAEERLRLIYLSVVREDKGIFVLLDALRDPLIKNNASITCDIYGPVFRKISDRFEDELSRTPNATYRGVLEAEKAVSVLRQHDVFVFPSYYRGEGHPGVLMESMMAGIPVIAAEHRSIPELVHDRVNGLLIPPEDSHSLAKAIESLARDRRLLIELGRNNWERREQHAAATVVPQILRLMGLHVQ